MVTSEMLAERPRPRRAGWDPPAFTSGPRIGYTLPGMGATNSTADDGDAAATPTGGLGTFGGVFTPSVLTILGLVLFLRLGFVTGNVGLTRMLLILFAATSVSILTTISLAAIATNLRVGGGGVYYLISRTLGPAFGGAIGLVLYLAMSVSVAFYAIGLGEAVASVVGSDSASLPRLIAAVTIVLLLGLAWLGADIATRFQYVVMVCLIVAIVGYVVGVVPDMETSRLRDSFAAPSGGEPFWVAFAIFFPAITGFTQGVAMSGDLKTPSRSITRGTFAAIGLSTVVYLFVIFTFAAAVPLGELRDDTAIMRRLAVAPAFVDVGVIAATLSSAIASMLGGPRTLQRLAADRLVARLEPLGVGAGPDDNPRRAVLLTTGIALVTVALGDLDLVAPVISMFFLASYGLINFATYNEARAQSTSFRPTFRFFDWRLSLLGTLACLGAILAIDPVAGAFAAVAVFALYTWLERSISASRWADSTRGHQAARVRTGLQQMAESSDAGRDWRPVTVAFVPRDPGRRERLVRLAGWFEGGAGFTTVTRIVRGRGPIVRRHASSVDRELARELSFADSAAYHRVLVADDLDDGVAAMIQAHGLGPLRTNLALFSGADIGQSAPPDGDDLDGLAAERGTMVQTALRFGINVGVLSASESGWRALDDHADGPIAVWWTDDRTGRLLTLLAWMCTRTPDWSGRAIEVHLVGDDPQRSVDVQRQIDDARLPATVVGAVDPDDFVEATSAAAFVLAPLRVRHGRLLGPADRSLSELSERLGLVVFVQAAAEVALDVQPDDAPLALVADARERAEAAASRAEELDGEASRLMVAAEMLRIELGSEDPSVTEAVEASAAAQRTYLDARARAEEAWRIVAELDPSEKVEAVDPSVWVPADEVRSAFRRGGSRR